jgi:hypothetical protein
VKISRVLITNTLCTGIGCALAANAAIIWPMNLEAAQTQPRPPGQAGFPNGLYSH